MSATIEDVAKEMDAIKEALYELKDRVDALKQDRAGLLALVKYAVDDEFGDEDLRRWKDRASAVLERVEGR